MLSGKKKIKDPQQKSGYAGIAGNTVEIEFSTTAQDFLWQFEPIASVLCLHFKLRLLMTSGSCDSYSTPRGYLNRFSLTDLSEIGFDIPAKHSRWNLILTYGIPPICAR